MELETHLGNYGHIQYGNTIIGRLHYPVSNRNACSRFNKEDFSNDYLFDEKNDMTPIILIDHGQCSHVTKTKNAQDFGLKAAIIIDDDAWDLDSLRKTDDFYVDNEIKGFQLTIPYFKIFSSQGKKLIQYLENTRKNHF